MPLVTYPDFLVLKMMAKGMGQNNVQILVHVGKCNDDIIQGFWFKFYTTKVQIARNVPMPTSNAV